ncbi:MAG TPA: exodeoxyribonuclease VII large subunit, partial [Candidatus Paceibacterota bacterium]
MPKLDLTQHVFSVSEYLDLVNELLVGAKLIVQGEITELKIGSQWVGFTLKDSEDGSLLKCVLGGWQYRKLGVPLENGMQVKVGGVPKISKKWGSFGFWVDSIEPLGEGSLKKAYELLLKQLKAEGLYDRKCAVPEFTQRLA